MSNASWVASQPPGGRGEVRVEAREVVGSPSRAGVPGVRDRARDLRQLELVGEDRRRLAPPRLPDVEGGEREVRERGASERRTSRSGRAGRGCGSRSLGRASSERRAGRLGGGRSRQATPAAAHAATSGSSRSAAASGIVTSTSSLVSAIERRLDLVERAEHDDAVHAAPPDVGVVVEEADHAHAGGLAQLAGEAPPRPAGADERTRRRGPCGRPPQLRAEPEHESRAGDEHRAEHRVEREHLPVEAARAARASADDAERDEPGQRRRRRRSRAGRARVAKRQTRR